MQASQFLTEFSRNYARFSIQRVMVDILATCMSQFTPQGLEFAVRDGWSAVGFISGLTPDALKEFLMCIPSVRSAQRYMADPASMREISTLITPQDIFSDFTKRFPEQSKALSGHPQWLVDEITKAKVLLG